MKYNNIDKRCILIFPRFKNIDLIQKIIDNEYEILTEENKNSLENLNENLKDRGAKTLRI